MSTLLAPAPRRSTGAAYLFLILLGGVGGHHFYLGNTARGILYVFTLGLLGVGVVVDFVSLPAQVRSANISRALGL